MHFRQRPCSFVQLHLQALQADKIVKKTPGVEVNGEEMPENLPHSSVRWPI